MNDTVTVEPGRRIMTTDGEILDGTLYRPPGAARGAVLIVPAMGVSQRFYAPVATWLAGRGLVTLTFDYRGMGRSRRGSLRDLDIDVVGWAERDVPAALAAVQEAAPGLPLSWLGHSLGGQLIGLTPGLTAVGRFVTVASGSGWWRENAPPLRRRVPLLWFVVAPLTLPLFGYFPGRRLGMVGDLPRGVMAQWRRWCLHPDYIAGVEPDARARFARVSGPLTSIAFDDDEMMSPANVEALHALYTGVERRRVRLTMADVAAAGQGPVGHFGFFRADRTPLWERYLWPALDAAARL